MKKINTDVKYIFFKWVILALLVIPAFAHHGNLILDCGREVYYPTQILLGKVLYKDLFNIYGPFSYMFNALLFKLFGINLNVLYITGCVYAGMVSTMTYLIAKRFLPRFLSFTIAIFTICVGVLNVNLFNFIFPYSYAVLYGLLAFLMSFWLLLKYISSPEKMSYLYASCVFAGLSFSNKYEFLPYLFVILYSIIKIKPLNFKNYFYSFLSLIAVPVLCFAILFSQGLTVGDLISTVAVLNKIASSETLKYFYSTQGVAFTAKTLPFLVLNFLKTVIPLGLLLLAFKKITNKIAFFALISVSLCLMAFFTNPASFAFFPILIVALAVFDFKNIKRSKPLLILTLSAILVSFKSFWGLATLNYGAFFISFLLTTVLALLADKFKTKNINFTLVGVYILIVSIILGVQNLSSLSEKNQLISTPRGKIYTTKYLYSATNDLIKYIKSNTKITDTVVVFPEGPFINFLTDRKSDDYYNSLIPLYVEVFGEEKLIGHFEKTKPDYIIFNNWDSKDYYFRYICSDYAVSFCNFVATNYTQQKVIDKGFRYLIFKSKFKSN